MVTSEGECRCRFKSDEDFAAREIQFPLKNDSSRNLQSILHNLDHRCASPNTDCVTAAGIVTKCVCTCISIFEAIDISIQEIVDQSNTRWCRFLTQLVAMCIVETMYLLPSHSILHFFFFFLGWVICFKTQQKGSSIIYSIEKVKRWQDNTRAHFLHSFEEFYRRHCRIVSNHSMAFS